MFLEVDEDFPEHPKTVRFCAVIGDPNSWTHLFKLWRWCCKFQHDGDLTSYSNSEIEQAAGWTGETGVFFQAAADAGFLDIQRATRNGERTCTVHNWMNRQGKALSKLISERDRLRKYRLSKRGEKDDKQQELLGSRTRTVHDNLTLPNQTKPKRGKGRKTTPSHPDQKATIDGFQILFLAHHDKKPEWSPKTIGLVGQLLKIAGMDEILTRAKNMFSMAGRFPADHPDLATLRAHWDKFTKAGKKKNWADAGDVKHPDGEQKL